MEETTVLDLDAVEVPAPSTEDLVAQAVTLRETLDKLNNRVEELTLAAEFASAQYSKVQRDMPYGHPTYRAAWTVQAIVQNEYVCARQQRDNVAAELVILRKMEMPEIMEALNQFRFGEFVFERATT